MNTLTVLYRGLTYSLTGWNVTLADMCDYYGWDYQDAYIHAQEIVNDE